MDRQAILRHQRGGGMSNIIKRIRIWWLQRHITQYRRRMEIAYAAGQVETASALMRVFYRLVEKRNELEQA